MLVVSSKKEKKKSHWELSLFLCSGSSLIVPKVDLQIWGSSRLLRIIKHIYLDAGNKTEKTFFLKPSDSVAD